MHNKIALSILFFSLSLALFGQEFPKSKTAAHQQIPGTNIFMIPPSTFVPSGNFKGFQNPSDQTSMIMAMEIPGPFSEVTKGFNADMLQARGMQLNGQKQVNLGGFDGLMMELDQPANGMVFSKQILIYGDENNSTLLNGVYLKDSIELGQKIKESMLSIVIDTSLDIDPRASLDYTLDETAGGLRFKGVIGNGMLLNRDLKTPTESPDKATVITDKSFAPAAIDNKKEFCISRLKNYPDPHSLIKEKGINAITLDGLKGFELFAKNNNKINEELYQVILFDPNGGYYLLIGTYVSGSEEATEDVQKIIRTFQRRK